MIDHRHGQPEYTRLLSFDYSEQRHTIGFCVKTDTVGASTLRTIVTCSQKRLAYRNLWLHMSKHRVSAGISYHLVSYSGSSIHILILRRASLINSLFPIEIMSACIANTLWPLCPRCYVHDAVCTRIRCWSWCSWKVRPRWYRANKHQKLRILEYELRRKWQSAAIA